MVGMPPQSAYTTFGRAAPRTDTFPIKADRGNHADAGNHDRLSVVAASRKGVTHFAVPEAINAAFGRRDQFLVSHPESVRSSTFHGFGRTGGAAFALPIDLHRKHLIPQFWRIAAVESSRSATGAGDGRRPASFFGGMGPWTAVFRAKNFRSHGEKVHSAVLQIADRLCRATASPRIDQRICASAAVM